jgi:septal ring factor EnvC (AmiA/AmiB activator)
MPPLNIDGKSPCDGCTASEEIRELRATLNGMADEIKKLADQQKESAKDLNSVSSACRVIQATTSAIDTVVREDVKTLFRLAEEHDKRIAGLDRDVIKRPEHEQLREKVDTLNVRLAKIIGVTSLATGVVTTIITTLVQKLAGGLF